MPIGKKSLLIVPIVLIILTGYGQPIYFNQQVVDSLEKLLPGTPADSNKVNNLVTLARMYHHKVDTTRSLGYARMADTLSQKLKYESGRVQALSHIAFYYAFRGNWPKSFATVNIALPLAERADPSYLPSLYGTMAINYADYKDDIKTAKAWSLKSLRHPTFATRPRRKQWGTYMLLTQLYTSENNLDSAEYYGNILKTYFDVKVDEPGIMNNSYRVLGDIAYRKKNYSEALDYFRPHENNAHLAARIFEELKQTDSAIHYAKIALNRAVRVVHPRLVIESSSILARLYAETNPQLAYQYLQLSSATKDTVYSSDKLKEEEELTLANQKAQFERESQDASFRNRIIQIALIALAAVFLISTLLFFRSNKIKQTANRKLEKAYGELKTTQAQLIQSEKMASLGELTAGIAHEIQNPLNFVNNFSEVNNELVDELKAELVMGNVHLANQIADNIKDNGQKVSHHGKRADAIVKGMLQHSRTSSGQKEPTDINALADEYLRLAYHGVRAKDKSFNASFRTDFDSSLSADETGIGKINILSQEIGRVMLNLVNNAFYAVQEKQKQNLKAGLAVNPCYEPVVTVSTRKQDGKVEIEVRDNGVGIPQKNLDKIFQPFFTTKPTGEGTGLGLSLAYDIVTKGHGGKIRVETNEGSGTAFIVELPAR